MKELTQKAKRIVFIASVKEAKKSGFSVVLPDHVAVALLKDSSGPVHKALNNLDIEASQILEFLQKFLEKSEFRVDAKKKEKITLESIKKTVQEKGFLDVNLLLAEVQDLLGLASKEAKLIKSHFVTTDHLFLALLNYPNSLTYNYFKRNRITIRQLRQQLRQVQKKTVSGSPSEKTAFQGYYSRPFSTKQFPTLSRFTKDITHLAYSKQLDPVIHREEEIVLLTQILERRYKNNPILIGEPGVGKTAIVEGLAQRIVEGKVPRHFRGKRILSLDMLGLLAGTKYRGDFEERFKNLTDELVLAKDVIFFIDEIHNMVGAGEADGAMDAANILKPMLSKGTIRCIGASTLTEYRFLIEKDSALERRFQSIIVKEPSVQDTIYILKKLKKHYEDYHKVVFTPEAIEAIVTLSQQYVPKRFFPDKALDILDELASKRKLQLQASVPRSIEEMEATLANLNYEKQLAINNQNYEGAAILRDTIASKRKQLEKLLREWEKTHKKESKTITHGQVAQFISQKTGIPLTLLNQEEKDKLLYLESQLKTHLIGQDSAITKLSSALRRSRLGLSSANKPIGSFLFLGTTGIGKTYLAKLLSLYLFGTEKAVVRLDMSDFMEKHSISRLVGSPPGYVGYEQGGLLTEKIRHRPYSIVLFDELEKAHPDVFNLLLQVLEEGELQDNLGNTISFKNCLLIMTSNAGTALLQKAGLGFVEQKHTSDERQAALVFQEIKRLFKPEFLNRLDEIILFNSLNKEQLRTICRLALTDLQERLKKKFIQLSYTKDTIDYITDHSYRLDQGARSIKRGVQKLFEEPLSLFLLQAEALEVTKLRAYLEDKQLKFSLEKNKKRSPRRSHKKEVGTTFPLQERTPSQDSSNHPESGLESKLTTKREGFLKS